MQLVRHKKDKETRVSYSRQIFQKNENFGGKKKENSKKNKKRQKKKRGLRNESPSANQEDGLPLALHIIRSYFLMIRNRLYLQLFFKIKKTLQILRLGARPDRFKASGKPSTWFLLEGHVQKAGRSIFY